MSRSSRGACVFVAVFVGFVASCAGGTQETASRPTVAPAATAIEVAPSASVSSAPVASAPSPSVADSSSASAAPSVAPKPPKAPEVLKTPPGKGSQLKVDETASRKIVKAKIGDSVLVSLDAASGSTGYVWRATTDIDKKVATVKGPKESTASAGFGLGGPTTYVWTIRAVGKGTTTFTAHLARGENEQPAQTFRIEIEVE